MGNLISGINEDDLSTLSLEVLDYADRISEIFDKIDALVEQLPNNYSGEPCREIIEYYMDLKLNYAKIRQNIISYSEDFVELIKKMQENDKYITTLFQEFTDETKNQIKSINEIGGM